nr:unnamed protein product [Callosobruchus chinensis]
MKILISLLRPSNILTLYKAQIRPSLECCSHIWAIAAPTTSLSIVDAVQRTAICLIDDLALTWCHLQPLSHRRVVGDLSLFYRYSNGFCSSELRSKIPPLIEPARCTRGTSSSHPKAIFLHASRTKRYELNTSPRCTRGTSSFHPKAVVLHTSRTERYDRTFIPRVSRAWNGLPGDLLVEPARVGLFKSRVNKLPLT